MEDSWTKKLENGTVTYTTTGEVGAGFVHTVRFERGDVITTTSRQSTTQPTRQEVEELFEDDVSKMLWK